MNQHLWPEAGMSDFFPEPRAGLRDRLTAGDLALQRAMTVPRLLRRHEVLAHMGQPMRMVYRLCSGALARSMELPDGTRQITMIRLPGDLMGLRGMLMDRQLDSLRAVAPSTVQAIEVEKALELAEQHPDVAWRVMWQLAEDERRLHNWVLALGRGNAAQRIATLVLDLRGRLMQAGLIDNNRFALPLTQQEIGQHLGLTLVHVNRTLKKLRDQRVMTLRGRVVEVLDLEALSRYAAPMQDFFERENPAFGSPRWPGVSVSPASSSAPS